MHARKTPCSECPFMDFSAPGWLGPYKDSSELHNVVMSEIPFACHKEVNISFPGEDEVLALTGDLAAPVCAGSLAYMKKCFKRPRDPQLRLLLDNVVVPEHAMDYRQLRNHHNRK
jgi:hypothetical protein